MCVMTDCKGGCVDGGCLPSDASVDGDASGDVDVGVEPPGDASCSGDECAPDASSTRCSPFAPDDAGGCKQTCASRHDCEAPNICRQADHTCGPGQPGERCWPLVGNPGVWDGNRCMTGNAGVPPEVVGACSFAARRSRGAEGWLALLLAIGCLRGRRRLSPT
jgi:hypothetical protein